jgi:hypothetical protein
MNCKTEGDRLLKLAKELQAAEKANTPGLREAERELAWAHAKLGR